MYWENAPDYRTSRTLDWLNDACEAKLGTEERDHRGVVTYTALMSPTSIGFIFHEPSQSFDWKRPFTRKNRAKLRLGKKQFTRTFPTSLLLTKELTTTDTDGNDRQIQPYVLLGTKRWLGRGAAVKRYKPAEIECADVQPVTEIFHDPVRRKVDRFQCKLRITTVVIDVRFATKFEATTLFQCLESKPAAAESGP